MGVRLLKEPLCQFFLIGACLFGLQQWFAEKETPRDVIHINAERIAPLRAQWKALYGRNPSPDETARLIDEAVREEVLVREALALGIDQDDPVIRQRLASKLMFLSHQYLEKTKVGESDWRAWHAQHRGKYRQPATHTFSHIFFSRRLRGDGAARDAELLLQRLDGPPATAGARQMGDRFMLHRDYTYASAETVHSHFGAEFAKHLAQLPEQEWHGPVPSVAGVHLVWVTARRPATDPPYEAVSAAVKRDYAAWRREQAEAQFMAALKRRYRIVIDNTEPRS